MNKNGEKKEELLMEESVQPKGRKKFQRFSMGFLLLLLALVVAVYVVCTILSA